MTGSYYLGYILGLSRHYRSILFLNLLKPGSRVSFQSPEQRDEYRRLTHRLVNPVNCPSLHSPYP